MSNTANDKFMTMVGFAKRSGKIVYGYDNLGGAKGVKLLAVGDSASDNLKRAMTMLSEKKGIPLVSVVSLERKLGNNIKALGLTDANMVKAVLDYVNQGAPDYSIKK